MSNVEKISIALPRELVSLLKARVEGGDYASSSEIVREALRDWKDKQARKAMALKEMRRLIREGEESGTSRYASIDDIKIEARRQFEDRRKTG